MGLCQVLPLLARVDLRAMSVKGYSAIPKAPALPEFHESYCFVTYPGTSLSGGVLPICKDAVGLFYGPDRLGFQIHIVLSILFNQ